MRVHRALRDDARRRASTRIRDDPARRRERAAVTRHAALAAHRAAHAEGMDRAEGGRRRAGRGDVPRAPGAARRACATNPEQLAMLEALDAELPARRSSSTQPGGSSPASRRSRRRATGAWARTRTRTAGKLTMPLELPDFERVRGRRSRSPGTEQHESTRQLGAMLARHLHARTRRTFASFCPDETNSNRLGAVFEVENRCFVEPHDRRSTTTCRRDGRVMEVLSEHNCEGWLEGYVLTGRHGLFATYEAFALIVASMATQHAKWLEACARAAVARARSRRSTTCSRRPAGATTTTASAIKGPGFMDTIISKKGTVARVYLPPDANCLLSVADHCLRSNELREPHHHRQAAAAAVARHATRRASTARAARRSGSGRAPTTGERARRRARLRGRHRRRSRRWRRRAWLRKQRARAARARRQRRRPDDALLADASTRTG